MLYESMSDPSQRLMQGVSSSIVASHHSELFSLLPGIKKVSLALAIITTSTDVKLVQTLKKYGNFEIDEDVDNSRCRIVSFHVIHYKQT